MKRFLASITVVVSASAAHGATLFGVGNFDGFNPQRLYSINTATGAATDIGSTGLAEIAGIAYDLDNDRLVALAVSGDLFTLDRSTGASTLLTNTSFAIPEGDLAIAGGVRYTTAFDDLHVQTGMSYSPVGASGLSADFDISGLAFGPGGVLFGVAANGTDPDSLVSYNLVTGAATVVAPITGANLADIGGLTFDFLTGTLLLTDGGSLFTLNAATGQATLVGPHNAQGFSGLAFVPSPAGAAALALGGLMAARRRR